MLSTEGFSLCKFRRREFRRLRAASNDSSFRRAREGELPCRGKRSWPGPRPGAPRPVDWSRRGISPLRRRVTFSAMRKSPKNRWGTPQGRTAFAMPALPQTPIIGVIPSRWHGPSGAQNQECLLASLSGPTGGLNVQNLRPMRLLSLRLGSLTNVPEDMTADYVNGWFLRISPFRSCRPTEPKLSPTHTKALSTRGVPAFP